MDDLESRIQSKESERLQAKLQEKPEVEIEEIDAQIKRLVQEKCIIRSEKILTFRTWPDNQ